MKEIIKVAPSPKAFDLEFAPKDIFVETVFYKHSKNAHLFFLLFFAGLFFLFIGFKLFDDYIFPIVVICLLFIVPVFSVLSKRGWFSFSAMDERKLRIDSKGIQVGLLYFKFEDIDELDVFFHSFHNQLYIYKDATSRAGAGFLVEDGNKNELRFNYGSDKYYFRFILRNLEAYEALRTIIQFWVTLNNNFSAKEKYPIAIVHQFNRT